MRYYFFVFFLATTTLAISLLNSIPDESRTPHVTFRSQIQTGASLRYVANSGICETTPGVNQYSGYIEVGKNMSMWFWFFEARHAPEIAPFTLYGGPGCSSMSDLFTENGPCKVNGDGKTTYLNPYSWNNVSHAVYIDEPIGAGFSYGLATVNSTETAAPFVWNALQVLFESQVFSKYASREFVFATKSYGGHYAPSFVTHFHEQNTKIIRGDIEGECIIVSAVMINDGWIDPLIQWQSFYDFAKNAPGYGQLQPDDVLKNISDALYGPNGCVEQQKNCYAAGKSPESDEICNQAFIYCLTHVLSPAVQGRDAYDLRPNSPEPDGNFLNYLSIPEVLRRIGAEINYPDSDCNSTAYNQFQVTGNLTRTMLPQLSKLADTGLNILVWVGGVDIICNWLGNYALVLAMDWYGKETLRNTPLRNITLHGTTIAAVVNVDNFSYATVYNAGHSVALTQPEAVLEIFKQVVNKEPLHSV